MKKIGVIIVSEDEPVSRKYYLENRDMLQVLKNHGISMFIFHMVCNFLKENKKILKKNMKLKLFHFLEII